MSNTVIITGASGGIGSAIARKFAENGWNVAIMYNNSLNDAQTLESELKAYGVDVYTGKCDVSDMKQVENYFNCVKETFGTVDALVNNAGVALQKLFTDVTDEEAQRIFDINVKGTFNCAKTILPQMINNKKGKIVNISSMWGLCGASCEVHYSASKAAVIGFTKALAKEVAPSSINVNCVAPGLINTKMNSNINVDDLEAFIDEIPLMRAGTPEDVANAVYFLCSHDSDYITGQVISVDGGMII